MKKIRLDVDALEVVSFTTAAHPERRGTVQGAQTGYCTRYHTCYETIGWVGRDCLGYPQSYWGEESCTCPPVEVTDPVECLYPVDTADESCQTCPGTC